MPSTEAEINYLRNHRDDPRALLGWLMGSYAMRRYRAWRRTRRMVARFGTRI